MSQPVQPPNQPQQPYGAQPVDGNPYAGGPGAPASAGDPYGQQPPAPYGQQAPAPTGNPFADQQGQQPGPFGGGTPFAPAPPAPPARNNILYGVLAALGAAIVAGVLYGVLMGSIEREFGYAAVGVGFLIGFAAGKLGGANPVIIGAAAVLSIAAVYLGQLIGYTMVMADVAHVSFSDVLFDHFDAVTRAWTAESGFMTYVFFAFGALAAFGGVKKAN
ncbi:hypothetical protein [Streptomyces sp. NPDC057552]|uniref:hypothetical protein n=1 Tax=Streptomyces sp. NPDC057552 TaxID=3350537 RepID=UPI0036A10733